MIEMAVNSREGSIQGFTVITVMVGLQFDHTCKECASCWSIVSVSPI